MSEEQTNLPIDDLIDRVEAGAKAGGARAYLIDYIPRVKAGVFDQLVNTPPNLENLLRVWAWAVGIDHLEKDLKQTIVEGREAREVLNQAPGTPGQAE